MFNLPCSQLDHQIAGHIMGCLVSLSWDNRRKIQLTSSCFPAPSLGISGRAFSALSKSWWRLSPWDVCATDISHWRETNTSLFITGTFLGICHHTSRASCVVGYARAHCPSILHTQSSMLIPTWPTGDGAFSCSLATRT